MLYKLYILYAPVHERLFVGVTSSLTDRMKAHNSNNPEDWTSVYKPWTLVHMELFNEPEEASQRERFFESADGEAYVKDNILPLFQF